MGKKKLIVKKLKKVKGFYSPPKVLITWKKDEEGNYVLDHRNNRISTASEEYESEWGELFFDLIYVAMAFKLGDIVFAEIDNSMADRALLFFCPTFLLLHVAWLERVQFMAVFSAIGTLHQMMDVFEALSIAFAAAHITSVDQFLASDYREDAIVDNSNQTRLLAPSDSLELNYGYNYAFGFSVSILGFFVIQTIRGLEVKYFGVWEDDTLDRKALRRTGAEIVMNKLVRVIGLSCAILTSRLGLIWETTVIWLISYFLSILTIVVRLGIRFSTGFDVYFCSFEGNYARIPTHVAATIKRYGEWTMLMLGEGVLQIIIQVITEDHEITHNLSFALCFGILAMVQLTDYKNMPFEPSAHVIRRSGPRALVWFNLMPIFSGSLIWVGVGLKSVLKKHYKLNSEKEDLSRFAWLLCGSLSLCLFTLFWTKALHPGFRNIFVDISSKIGWCCSFLGSLLFLILPILNLSGPLLLGICLGIVLFLAAISELTNEYTELEVVPEKFEDRVGPIDEEEILEYEDAQRLD